MLCAADLRLFFFFIHSNYNFIVQYFNRNPKDKKIGGKIDVQSKARATLTYKWDVCDEKIRMKFVKLSLTQ